MKHFLTSIMAIDPSDGVLKEWAGEVVKAPSFKLAEEKLNAEGKGYMKVVGELIGYSRWEDGKLVVDESHLSRNN